MRLKYEIVQESPAVDEITKEISSEPVSMIYPTPFSHYTSIKYHVPKQENVSIIIYDEAGRLVRMLVDETMSEGSYTARWDGKDTSGRKVATGSYFCVVKTNGSSSTKVVHIQ
jgi:flagellar hook assembly protein FlgD